MDRRLDIRWRRSWNFPQEDSFISTFKEVHREDKEPVDAEVYFVNLLTSAVIGPRVLENELCLNADVEAIVRRFRHERLRMLKQQLKVRWGRN